MNRRKFFGMSATALVVAGLPLSLLPERTIFLPPKGGLWAGWKMREVAQYLINNDSIPMCFDIGWVTRNGDWEQGHFEAPEIPYAQLAELSEHEYYRAVADLYRDQARAAITRLIPLGARPRELYLPRAAIYADVQ